MVHVYKAQSWLGHENPNKGLLSKEMGHSWLQLMSETQNECFIITVLGNIRIVVKIIFNLLTQFD